MGSERALTLQLSGPHMVGSSRVRTRTGGVCKRCEQLKLPLVTYFNVTTLWKGNVSFPRFADGPICSVTSIGDLLVESSSIARCNIFTRVFGTVGGFSTGGFRIMSAQLLGPCHAGATDGRPATFGDAAGLGIHPRGEDPRKDHDHVD